MCAGESTCKEEDYSYNVGGCSYTRLNVTYGCKLNLKHSHGGLWYSLEVQTNDKLLNTWPHYTEIEVPVKLKLVPCNDHFVIN